MTTINMKSKADTIKGQGVLSAYEEQVALIREELGDEFDVSVNQPGGRDIVHFHTINPGYFLSLPMLRLRSKTVGYVHFLPETLDDSIHLPALARAVFYRYVIRFYKSMDRLVTVNPDFIDRLQAYGIPREKVTYIPNFVSEEQFFPVSASEKRALRERYGIEQDRFVVFCAGQLQKRKGLFDFVALARRMPQVQFLWAGNFAFGAISDGYAEIKKILEDPPKNVRFMGLVERAEMNGLYNLANVMFLPSYGELFPMTILEAMNCGTPVLLRDLELYENILFDFYLKGHSNADFESQIRNLMEDGIFYAQAAQRARRGHVFYGREHVAQMWRCFYESVLEQNRVPEKRAGAGKWLPLRGWAGTHQ